MKNHVARSLRPQHLSGADALGQPPTTAYYACLTVVANLAATQSLLKEDCRAVTPSRSILLETPICSYFALWVPGFVLALSLLKPMELEELHADDHHRP
jgi:hypothetical protein